jgi:hypothetical protein
MPKNSFRPEEVTLLRGYVERWRQLKLEGVPKTHVRGNLKPMNQFVKDVMYALFEEFPDRDADQTDQNEFTWVDEELRTLPAVSRLRAQLISAASVSLGRLSTLQRIRQWLNNQTRDTAVNAVKAVRSGGSQTTARHLVQKKYSSQIEALAKVLMAEDPSIHIMKARNNATTIECNRLKEEDSVEWQKLEQLALDIRKHASLDYSEQTPEALDKYVFHLYSRRSHIGPSEQASF